MTNPHPYSPSYLYRARVIPDRIPLNIQRCQVDDAVMKRLSICDNLPRGHVLYLLFILRRPNFLISLLHYLNRIVQPTTLTVNIRHANQVMSPHIQKIENWNDIIMFLFSMHHISKNCKLKWEYYIIILSMQLTDAFSSLLYFPGSHFF